MGRHAKGVTRSKVSVASVILGMLIVGSAVGFWLSSPSQSAPIVSTAGGRMFPIGPAVPALLALGAAFALWIDSRRSRRSLGRGRRMPAHEVVGDDGRHRRPDADSEVALVGKSESRVSLAGDVVEAEVVQAEVVDNGRHGPLSVIRVVRASMADGRGLGMRSPDHAAASGEGDVEAGFSSVDLAFPFTSNLAASLRDELFTHRGVSS